MHPGATINGSDQHGKPSDRYWQQNYPIAICPTKLYEHNGSDAAVGSTWSYVFSTMGYHAISLVISSSARITSWLYNGAKQLHLNTENPHKGIRKDNPKNGIQKSCAKEYPTEKLQGDT